MVAQRLVVDHDAAAQVEEQAARAHLGELLPAEQAGVARPSVDVQRDRLGLGQQLVEAVAAAGVAQGQLVGDVVEEHPHAQRLGHHRQLAADVAVADDAEGAAADLVRALGRLVPLAVVHLAFLSVRCRAIEMISAMASSTTLRVLEYGALNTARPRADAAVRSIWLVPMQKAPTASSPGARSSTPR